MNDEIAKTFNDGMHNEQGRYNTLLFFLGAITTALSDPLVLFMLAQSLRDRDINRAYIIAARDRLDAALKVADSVEPIRKA